MKWNAQRLIFANNLLQLAYETYPDFTTTTRAECNDEDGKPMEYAIREEICEILEDDGLIDIDLTRSSHPVFITLKGRSVLDNKGSYIKYRSDLIKIEKKANRQRIWDLIMKYVRDFNEIGKAIKLLIPSVLFVLSIIFSEEVTTFKKTIQDYLKPNTTTQPTTTTDTIQKPITKGH